MKKTLVLGVLFAFILSIGCNHQTQTTQEEIEDQVWIDSAKSITSAVQKVLGSQLKGAIERQGLVHAIDYCNERALPLTDSLSKIYGVGIKRTSKLIRNPLNKATAAELDVLDHIKQCLKAGNDPHVKRNTAEGQISIYEPIMIQPLCLNCHGAEDHLSDSVRKALNTRYPKDRAVNYTSGDLRGMWVVSFSQVN